MDPLQSVLDGSCTDCSGPNPADCAVATCDPNYYTFVGGVGCTGDVSLVDPNICISFCLR
jgi:hypothetical protein